MFWAQVPSQTSRPPSLSDTGGRLRSFAAGLAPKRNGPTNSLLIDEPLRPDMNAKSSRRTFALKHVATWPVCRDTLDLQQTGGQAQP